MQSFYNRRIDGLNLTHKTDIDFFSWIFLIGDHHFSGMNQATILTSQANCLSTKVINQHDNILLYFATKNPLDYFHSFIIGNAHTLNKRASLADLLQSLINLWATAVHYDGIHADKFEQNYIARKAFFEALFYHGISTVFNHDGLTVILTDIRQSLGQDFRLQ